MSKPNLEEVHRQVVTSGKAFVRIVEGTSVLLDEIGVFWTERLFLRFIRTFYRRRLRSIIAYLPPEISGEILAMAETLQSFPSTGFSSN